MRPLAITVLVAAGLLLGPSSAGAAGKKIGGNKRQVSEARYSPLPFTNVRRTIAPELCVIEGKTRNSFHRKTNLYVYNLAAGQVDRTNGTVVGRLLLRTSHIHTCQVDPADRTHAEERNGRAVRSYLLTRYDTGYVKLERVDSSAVKSLLGQLSSQPGQLQLLGDGLGRLVTSGPAGAWSKGIRQIQLHYDGSLHAGPFLDRVPGR